MNSNNAILYYLNRRQLGYDGIRKNMVEMVIDKMGSKCSNKEDEYDIGNTFSCQFSRNKNNLHLLGCSTERGEMIIQPTFSDNEIMNGPISRSLAHNNAVFNFAWAEPEMKLVTASGDHSSKLFSVTPTGGLKLLKMFSYDASVKSVMFCPGSSNIICGGAGDSTIKIWDARMNYIQSVLNFDLKIPNAHAIFGPKKKRPTKVYGISSLLFKNEQTVISSSLLDGDIKVWDLRKSYRYLKMFEPLPCMKYYHPEKSKTSFVGYMHMITNPQLTRLYASGVNGVIYCYSLDSTDNNAICQFSGHSCETNFTKISISNDGRYLFSGCFNKSGALWNTDFPYNEKPMLNFKTKGTVNKELSCSDWCADQACMKLATCSDSLPNVWTIHPSVEKDDLDTEIIRISSHRFKFPSKVYTAPIKLEEELKEKYGKETEKNIENWDTTTHTKVQNVSKLPVTPKKSLKILFSKTSCSQVSPQHNTSSTKSSPVTPTSNRKRKKSSVSPRNLIDHYFLLDNKRGKLDSVNENE